MKLFIFKLLLLFIIPVCDSHDQGLASLNQTVTYLLYRARQEFSSAQNIYATFLKNMSYTCSSVIYHDASTRDDLISFRGHLSSCLSRTADFEKSYDNKEEKKSDGWNSVHQQVNFLKSRLQSLKLDKDTSSSKLQMLKEQIKQMKEFSILGLSERLQLQENIPDTSSETKSKVFYTYLQEQRRRRRQAVGKRLSKQDVCIEFQQKFCTVESLVSLDNDTFIASIKDESLLLHKHLNGSTLGIFRSSGKLRGLTKISDDHIVVGDQENNRLLILGTSPRLILVGEKHFQGNCPLGITNVFDMIAVGCEREILLYSETWVLMRRLKINLNSLGNGSFSFTFNPISKLFMLSDSGNKTLYGINLDGDIMFQKKSSWFPLTHPGDIAIAPSGDFYVVDEYQKRIVKYAPDGAYVGHRQKVIAHSLDISSNHSLLIGNYISSVEKYQL